MTMSKTRTSSVLFFFNDTATTEIYTLSLHDALPISGPYDLAINCDEFSELNLVVVAATAPRYLVGASLQPDFRRKLRSEEHTSELQSRQYLVCRLLLEKKNKINRPSTRKT